MVGLIVGLEKYVWILECGLTARFLRECENLIDWGLSCLHLIITVNRDKNNLSRNLHNE